MTAMGFTRKTFAVQEYWIRLDRKPVDEAAAKEAWEFFVKATGRTAVSDPEIISDETRYLIVGKIIDFPVGRRIRLASPDQRAITILE